MAITGPLVPAGPAPGENARQRLTFTEHHPLSNLDEVARRIDLRFDTMAPADVPLAKQEYDLAKESFDVLIPSTYRPEAPHGLFVWMGVTPMSPEWCGVLSRHKLIAVTAIPVNGRVGLSRTRLPLDAVHNLKKLYRVDENRIYVSGFSAGAGWAAQLVCAFPDVFRGGYFLMGGNFFVVHKTASGIYEPTLDRLAPTWKGSADTIRKDLRLVLMRAEGDPIYSPQEDRAQLTGLLLDGFERVTFMVLPGGGHRPPNALWFERGLLAFESPPRAPLVTTPTDRADPLPGQIGQAQRILATALSLLERQYPKQYGKEQLERLRQTARDRARKHLEQVVADYPTTPAAAQARRLLDGMDAQKSG